uniref:Uncharacterized protein n=1 Tax=Apteryx owenii TaxID=8824 RepID=A0A8B9PFI2_APTOW
DLKLGTQIDLPEKELLSVLIYTKNNLCFFRLLKHHARNKPLYNIFQGMSIAVLGPTFQNLADNVNKNVSDIYYIFVGRSLGYLGGSVLGGVLFDCMNAHLLLALSMLATTIGLYGIPWCKKSLLLTVLMSVIGSSMGILDTGK